MLKGFQAFITRGNVLDLATGVIIGAAFGGITKSLTEDVITPIIGMLGGQPDFSTLTIGAVGIGKLINAFVNFLITAAGLYFLIILPFNRFAARMAAAPAPAPGPTVEQTLLREIRDALVRRG